MDTEIVDETINKTEPEPTNYIPIWVFCLLSLFSLGLYDVYWFGINWKYIRDKEDGGYNAAAKGLFFFIYGFSLFRKFDKLASEKGYKGNSSMLLLFILYVGMRFAVYMDFWYVSLFAPIALIPIIKMMNFYYLTVQPNSKRNSITKNEIIFLVVFWVVVILILWAEVNKLRQ